jgi:hypothetical protein
MKAEEAVGEERRKLCFECVYSFLISLLVPAVRNENEMGPDAVGVGMCSGCIPCLVAHCTVVVTTLKGISSAKSFGTVVHIRKTVERCSKVV